MPLPILIVVSGPSGSGKTTLAHRVARAVGCPAICRDEIKEGMVHSRPGFTPSPGDLLTKRTFTTFFDVLDLLLTAEVTVVAEARFQGGVWRPHIERLSQVSGIRVIECVVDAGVALMRKTRRDLESPIRQAAHVIPAGIPSADSFEPISLDVPKLRVDTSDGYHPDLEDIAAFIRGLLVRCLPREDLREPAVTLCQHVRVGPCWITAPSSITTPGRREAAIAP